MKLLFKKPHLIFWISIPILMIIGLIGENKVLDINVHDTYYIISHTHLAIFISFNFGIIGLGYWLALKTIRKLSKLLSLIHIIITFGGIILIWILSQLFRESIMEQEYNTNLSLSITLITVIVILGQIIFPINIIRGLIKKNNKISK
jgi:heme/copper-type cytochrome/quinol oxidase subunit 1